MIGQTILHYRIIEELGRGGMGVVYKAHDPKLDRMIAIKVLPPHVAIGPAERARFEQEARAAATLNHPNVCTIYDIRDEGGQQFILMEYVDGVTLRQKLGRGALDPDAAVAYGLQIAEALQEAHSRGVIHRDVKAENIMVNSRNQVKVMDFGLAKLKGDLKLSRSSSTVGTLAYMSPEVIEGRDADARSDIFSLGVLMYELLTGQCPFRGAHEAAVMYSIVNEEPEPLDALVPGVPAVLVNLVSRALEKNPADRYQSAEEMAIEFRRLQRKSTKRVRFPQDQVPRPPAEEPQAGARESGPGPVPAPVASAPSFTRPGMKRAFIVLGGIILVAVALWIYRGAILPVPAAELHLTFRQLTDQPGEEDSPDISPDGNFIVYDKSVAGKSHIFLQRIGGGTPIALPPDSRYDDGEPTYSPDGQWIAFRSERDGGGIFIMGATGESVRRLTRSGEDPAWSPDGRQIVCASAGVSSPYYRPTPSRLWKINVERGEMQPLDTADAVEPQWSPHGTRIAYWGLPGGSGRRSIFTIDTAGRDRVTVIDDGNVNWNPVWSPDGTYLYFSSDRGGSLNIWRVPIDESTGRVRGKPEAVTTPAAMSGDIRVSRDGRHLIYVSGDHRGNIVKVGFDPARERLVGSPVPITEGSKQFISPDVSPDGHWVTFWSGEGEESIFVSRTDGSDLRQLTHDRFRNRGPVWSPDQKRIAFYSDRSGKYEIWSVDPDGNNLEQLTSTPDEQIHTPMWLPDGKHLLFHADSGIVEIDLTLPLEKRTLHTVVPEAGSGQESFIPMSISRDGLRIAGVHWDHSRPGGAIFTIQDQSYLSLPDSVVPVAWFSDNRRLLCARREGSRLYVVDLRTGKSRAMPSLPIAGMTSYCLSADDRTLYYTSEVRESDIWEAELH